MPRRLLDQDARREQRRQALLIERISRASERLLAKEIASATQEIGKAWSVTGQVKAPPEHERRISSILNRTWRTAIQAMGGRILEQGKSRAVVMVRKQSQDLFDRIQLQYLLTVGGEKIAEDIARTTVTQIMQIVAMGRRDGMGQGDISEQIRRRGPQIGRARGALIARTETHSAGNFAAIETAKETGLRMQKEWLSAEDERTRSAHIEADGQVVNLDEPFMVDGEELMYPGDMVNGSAGNVINCRCAQGFVVVD